MKRRTIIAENLPKVLSHEKCFEQEDDTTICNLCGKEIKRSWWLHGHPYGSECIQTVISEHIKGREQEREQLYRWFIRNSPIQPYSGDLWRLVDPHFDRLVYIPPPPIEDDSEPF
jgi:hypothetical protein